MEEKKKNKLNNVQKIEIVAAAFLTFGLVLSVLVFAWFTQSSKMETMTKIKSPDNLDIRAGNFQQIINFDLNGIDIEEMDEENKPEYRVFSVSAGDYRIAYKIQLAHTTNIPFKYSLYTATWKKDATGQNSSGTYVEYHPRYDVDDISYYELGEKLELVTLNPDDAQYGRVIAQYSGTIYDSNYDSSGDDPEIYAVPIYLQTKDPISPTNKEDGEHDYFVLVIEWDREAADKGFTKWNKAENNKETDIISITASRSTS